MGLFRRSREESSGQEQPLDSGQPAGPNAMEALLTQAQVEQAAELAERQRESAELLRDIKAVPNPSAMQWKLLAQTMSDRINKGEKGETAPDEQADAHKAVNRSLHDNNITTLAGSFSGRGDVHCSHCGESVSDVEYTLVGFSSADAYDTADIDDDLKGPRDRYVSLGSLVSPLVLREGYIQDDVRRIMVKTVNLHEMAVHPEVDPDLADRIRQVLAPPVNQAATDA